MKNMDILKVFGVGVALGYVLNLNRDEIKAGVNNMFGYFKNKTPESTVDNVDIPLESLFEEMDTEDEVSIDEDLLKYCEHMVLKCKPDYARSLYDHMNLTITVEGYITINDIVNLGWLSDETICDITSKYTDDECALFGWTNKHEHYYDAGASAGKNYMLISYPEDLTDIIYEKEPAVDIDCGSIMDAYKKWNKNADVLRFTIEELQELAPRTRRNAHAVLADLYEKLDDDYFVSVATLMQVIWDIEKDDLRDDISFKDRFPLMTKNYDEDTLINYGWEDDDDAFCSDATPDSDFYIIIKQPPHNITSLVEEWTKENHKEFEEETKNETAD